MVGEVHKVYWNKACWNWIGIYRMCAATSVGRSFDCICELGTASRNQTIAELKNCMSAPPLRLITPKHSLEGHFSGSILAEAETERGEDITRRNWVKGTGQMLQASCVLHKQLLAFLFINHPRFNCAPPPATRTTPCHGHICWTHRNAVEQTAFVCLFWTSRIHISAHTPATVTQTFRVSLSLQTLNISRPLHSTALPTHCLLT
jgi:hypothetical protein